MMNIDKLSFKVIYEYLNELLESTFVSYVKLDQNKVKKIYFNRSEHKEYKLKLQELCQEVNSFISIDEKYSLICDFIKELQTISIRQKTSLEMLLNVDYTKDIRMQIEKNLDTIKSKYLSISDKDSIRIIIEEKIILEVTDKINIIEDEKEIIKLLSSFSL